MVIFSEQQPIRRVEFDDDSSDESLEQELRAHTHLLHSVRLKASGVEEKLKNEEEESLETRLFDAPALTSAESSAVQYAINKEPQKDMYKSESGVGQVYAMQHAMRDEPRDGYLQ